MPDAIAKAQPGEAVDLGECAHQEQVRLLAGADLGHKIERLVEELDIGLVQGDQDVGRDCVNEADESLVADAGPGRVVGIGDEDHTGRRGDGGEHGIEVVPVVLRRHHGELAAEQSRDDRVHSEAVLRHDYFGAGPNQRVSNELEDFIGAVAKDQAGGREAKLGRELLLQIEGIAVGVKVDLRDGFAHRRLREP